MVLLLPNVLWHQRLGKYVKRVTSRKDINAELLCEEADVIFTIGSKKQ
jgi:hypothetical protein